MDKHDTVGIDCVAMCVNDIVLLLVLRPLDFPRLRGLRAKMCPNGWLPIVSGVADGLRYGQDALLIGGETAEMPGLLSRR